MDDVETVETVEIVQRVESWRCCQPCREWLMCVERGECGDSGGVEHGVDTV